MLNSVFHDNPYLQIVQKFAFKRGEEESEDLDDSIDFETMRWVCWQSDGFCQCISMVAELMAAVCIIFFLAISHSH